MVDARGCGRGSVLAVPRGVFLGFVALVLLGDGGLRESSSRFHLGGRPVEARG